MSVDGQLSEPFWKEAPAATGFRQREPLPGELATEETEVRVAIDGTTLFLGVLARDSRPAGVIARILQRDQTVRISDFEPGLRYRGEDVVAVLLDPFHDRRSAYVFITNPNGAEFEGLLTNDGQQMNVDWRGVYRVASHRSPEGWSTEFAIPLRSIRYPADSTAVWGFNALRFIARKNEETVWTSWGRDPEGFHRVSSAGHLVGIGGLPRPGANLDAKPYLLAGGTRTLDRTLAETSGRLEAGIDFKSEVAPGLLLDVTVNTDFAQAEVDDERVNLTRFSLFYPEKREFFLENAGVFEFGFRSAFEPPPFLMFFSRRIGVAEEGSVPLLGGLRLTGRVGRQSIGVLNVVTEPAFGVPRQNHSVVRIKRDFSTGGYLGAIATDHRSGEDWNTGAGVDFMVRPAPALKVEGYAAATAARAARSGFSGRLDAQYEDDRIGGQLAHIYVDRNARADLGFVTRTDIHRTDGSVRFRQRPKVLGLRKVDLILFGQRVANGAGLVQDWMVAPNLNPEWNSGESIYAWYGRGFNRLEDGFTLSERVAVPPGKYDAWQLAWFINTSPRRPIVLRSEAMFQGVYGGTIHSIGGEISAAPSPNFAIAVRLNRNLVDLPGGSFTADLATVRLTVAASTRFVVNALAQYNALDNDLGANLRIGYTFRPGSDLFLVINERRGSPTRLWEPRDRAGLLKLTYLSRF